MCSTYYIDGSTGEIVWSLGANSSFVFLDTDDKNTVLDYELKHMHHVRVVPVSLVHLPDSLREDISDNTHAALSVFDNAFDASKSRPTASSSSALILLLDLQAYTARIIEHYPHPRGKKAAMFGSLSLQPNGERFIGWGSGHDMSQHSSDGQVKFYAVLGDDDDMIGSYRAFKEPWIGNPTSIPDVYAYAWGCTWRSVIYVSWNGATEVRSYRVLGANDDERLAEFKEVAFEAKTGFETRLQADRFVEYVLVEALDCDGRLLGRSDVVRTYVPMPIGARVCSEWQCPAKRAVPRYELCGQDNNYTLSAVDLRQQPL